jgi:hypothetical protein
MSLRTLSVSASGKRWMGLSSNEWDSSVLHVRWLGLGQESALGRRPVGSLMAQWPLSSLIIVPTAKSFHQSA